MVLLIKNKSMISKIMLSYAFTFMMIELADSASMVIDGLIVSRHLGATMLAADGLGTTSFQMISLFCSMFAIGIQSLCSGAMGSGNSVKTHKYFTCGILTVSCVAVLATVFGYVCLDPLCHLFGADGSDKLLYDGLHEYLRGWFVGIPGFIAFSVLCPLVTLDGNKKLVTAMTVFQSILNIAGDWFSVVHWADDGLKAIYGVGFSTGAAFDIASLILILNFFRKRSAFRFDFGGISFKAVGEMVHIGMPRLTKYGCKLLAPLIVNRTVIAVGGAAAMAAMSVKASIGNFCLIAGNGIAESVNLLSQVFYSEKDKRALRETAATAVRADVIICTVFAALLFVLASPLAGIYLGHGTEEWRLTRIMLRCYALSLALNGLNACVLNYLQGTRKILPTHLQTASHRFVFLALCTVVLGYSFGTVGIFVAIPLSELLVLIAYVVIALVRGRGKKTSDALMLLPEDFGYAEDESLAFTLTTTEEVTGISEKVEQFCLSHGIDKKRAYYSALCLEETAGNVVDHGFKKDNKEHSCEVRVMIEDGDVILRVRDDCRYFNMKERYEVLKNGDTFSGIGIRLVYGIAKDVNYVNLLNTNTLIIRV